MSKFVALCCVLLPVACYAACAPGSDACNVMDEAVLMQKDLSLTQKAPEESAQDIDRLTVAKHMSEALSLQYLTQSAEAKLKQAKQLQDEFLPIKDELLAANAKYDASKRSEQDFETWYDAVSGGFGKMLTSLGSESKTASALVTESMKDLDKAFDNLELADTYGDQVTKLAVAGQRNGQAALIANVAKEQNDNVLKAMEAYQGKAHGGFVEKKFGKTLATVNTALFTMQSNIETFVQLNEQKVQQLKDAKAEYTSHSEDMVNKGLWQLLSVDKAKGRLEVAQTFDFGFKAREQEFVDALDHFAGKKSKTAKTDFKTLRSTITESLKKTELMVKSLNDADKKGEAEAKATVKAAFNNLADEGEIVQKVMKFATHWGRQRLQSDLLEIIQKDQSKMEDAFDTYEKSEDKDKAFGPMYGEVMGVLVGLRIEFAKWVTIGAAKEQELKANNLQLNAFMKQ